MHIGVADAPEVAAIPDAPLLVFLVPFGSTPRAIT